MKFAYLILTHGNPQQLYQLIQTLGTTNNTFIIHADGSVNLNYFSMLFEKYDKEKIVFIPARTEWAMGNISTVEAIMYLTRYLFKENIAFDYAHLLSSLDYPLMSNEEILDFFKTNNGRNFIECLPLSDNIWPHIGLDRVNYRWNLNSKGLYYYSDLEYKRTNEHWEQSADWPLYGGSPLWSLSYNCMKFLNETCNEKNNIYRFYRYSFKPEEMLFQTLMMNSPFKDSVINDNLRYSAGQSQERYKPEALTTLNGSKKLFALKPIKDIEAVNELTGNNSSCQTIRTADNSHPIKANPKHCVISAVGKNSLHRNWVKRSPKFDLHLIVYDDSFDTFKFDSPFVNQDKGYKFKLIYRYLKANKHLFDQYDYFYLPDDDIDIDTENIHRLFWYMKEYGLAIAQPAIDNSYYTFKHTTKFSCSLLHYTNFVEIMQPCFSKDALLKVLFTFNGNESGWGIDYHWGRIVDFGQYNMAIIDDVVSIHTRPVSSNNFKDCYNYIRLYDLNPEKWVLGTVPDINNPNPFNTLHWL
jgi:hypothetical protein